MGYYSDVTIKCGKKAFELFQVIFEDEELDIYPDFVGGTIDGEYQEFTDGNIVFPEEETKDCVIIYYQWIKWYTVLRPAVDMMEFVMDLLDDVREMLPEKILDKGEYRYQFVRHGEATDDVEIRGYGFEETKEL